MGTPQSRARRLPVLANPRSDRIREVASLAGRRARRRTGRVLVEGPQAVREAVRFCGEDLIDVYVSEAAWERHADLVKEAQGATRWVHPVSEEVSRAISTDSQGIAAVVADFRTLELVRRPWSFVVILPQTQDPGNAGTIIRIADAAGADAVLMCSTSVDPTSPKVVRASAGSVFHLPTIAGIGCDEAIEWARARSMTLLGADGAGSIDLFAAADGVESVDLARPTAWVFGNEAHGLSEEQAEGLDHLVSIPLAGHAESLNVAAAAAITLFATAKARRGSGGGEPS